MFDLTGRNALVTGASGGIGGAVAEALHAAGATVTLSGTREAPLRELADRLGSRAHVVTANLGDAAAVEALPKAAAEAMGSVDILVNNAGIQFRSPMLELGTADWQRVIDTNLTAAFVIGREAARRMAARGRGKIVNIGSLTSDLARPTIAPYAVSKGGIKMLTRAMAAEWGALGIQANAIGPGYMVTDMNQALIENPDFDAWVKARTPMRRWGQPEELVGLAIFLSSDASNFVSGQLIYADGGITAVL